MNPEAIAILGGDATHGCGAAVFIGISASRRDRWTAPILGEINLSLYHVFTLKEEGFCDS